MEINARTKPLNQFCEGLNKPAQPVKIPMKKPKASVKSIILQKYIYNFHKLFLRGIEYDLCLCSKVEILVGGYWVENPKKFIDIIDTMHLNESLEVIREFCLVIFRPLPICTY